MFCMWVLGERNGGLERLSKNQSAHSSNVKFLLEKIAGNRPSSRAVSRSRRKRSASSRSVVSEDSFLIWPSHPRYLIHQNAVSLRESTAPLLLRGLAIDSSIHKELSPPLFEFDQTEPN